MSEVFKIDSAVIPYISLVIKDEDPQGNPIVSTYKLAYDYAAIARAEELLHVDLKRYDCWKNITSVQTPQLVYAGMAKYHPDVTLEYIAANLNPQAQRLLMDGLFEYFFPGVIAACKKALESEPKNAESVATV